MARIRPGWTRLRGGCGGIWRHDTSGWVVRHCGHPTALWPYFGSSSRGGPMLLAANGRAFQHLADAQAAVESAVVAEFHADADQTCGRDWASVQGCACGHCRVARQHRFRPQLNATSDNGVVR